MTRTDAILTFILIVSVVLCIVLFLARLSLYHTQEDNPTVRQIEGVETKLEPRGPQ